MIFERSIVSSDEFMEFIERPENSERLYEFIAGEIVEVVSNGRSSALGAYISALISVWVYGSRLGWVTGADGGYEVFGEKYMPDAAFISKVKQPKPYDGAYNPTPPDLVIEVLSPSNRPDAMRIKIANFLNSGAVVWVFDPDKETVEVYTPGKLTSVLSGDDILDGGDLIPGFGIAVKSIFALGEDEA
jgi:Uma2 family endonuclease